MSTFSIPVPGGHLYLCDVVICTAALIFDPVAAFIVGGVGSFLGDLLFYPVAMFVSLFAHGLQAVIISVFARHGSKKHPVVTTVIGLILGSAVMVAGYSFGRVFIYDTAGTLESKVALTMAKLPFEIAQAAIGAAAGFLIVRTLKADRLYRSLFQKKH